MSDHPVALDVPACVRLLTECADQERDFGATVRSALADFPKDQELVADVKASEERESLFRTLATFLRDEYPSLVARAEAETKRLPGVGTLGREELAEQLRRNAKRADELLDAAIRDHDEIERLRAELATLRARAEAGERDRERLAKAWELIDRLSAVKCELDAAHGDRIVACANCKQRLPQKIVWEDASGVVRERYDVWCHECLSNPRATRSPSGATPEK